MDRWKIIAAKARGPDHEENGLPCQDAFAHRLDGERAVGVVCDGAGSARFSEQGAAALAEAVADALCGCDEPLPRGTEADQGIMEVWRNCAETAIAMVRDGLAEEAKAAEPGEDGEPATLRDYAATLVAAVAGPDAGLFLHIGDGAGAALNDAGDDPDWCDCTLSKPENGEFANETYFFTGDDWREKLRLTAFAASPLVVLVSDGAMGFTFADRMAGLEARFMGPVARFLDGVDEATGTKALQATLNRDDARRISADDKALVWIRRQDGP